MVGASCRTFVGILDRNLHWIHFICCPLHDIDDLDQEISHTRVNYSATELMLDNSNVIVNTVPPFRMSPLDSVHSE